MVVVVLVVEPAQEGVTLHERQNCVIVVMDYGVLPGCQFFEHKQPVMSENLTVENVGSVYQRLYLLSFLIELHEQVFQDVYHNGITCHFVKLRLRDTVPNQGLNVRVGEPHKPEILRRSQIAIALSIIYLHFTPPPDTVFRVGHRPSGE